MKIYMGMGEDGVANINGEVMKGTWLKDISGNLAALTAEFLANGGTIKQANGNNLAMNPLAQDIWPNREKVLRIFKEKGIKQRL